MSSHTLPDVVPFGSVTQLFQQARGGDPQALAELWQRFFPRLVGLANKTLRGRSQRVTDGEDAAQAALASFWRQLQAGAFADEIRRDALWNLLAKFTIRKVWQHQRDESAAKRGSGLVLGEDQLGNPDDSQARPLEELAATLPAHELDLYLFTALELILAESGYWG